MRTSLWMLMICLLSCTPDPPTPDTLPEPDPNPYQLEGDCWDQPDVLPGYGGWKPTHPAYFYYLEEVHPTKPSEFLYLRKDAITRLLEMYVYDMETETSRLIVSHAGFLSQNKHNWICFEDVRDRQLYKIKSNGDSLRQLTFEGRNWAPEWHPDGDKLIFVRQLPPDNLLGMRLVMNADGQILDTIPMSNLTGNRHQVRWSPDGTKIAVRHKSEELKAEVLGYYDYPSKVYHQLLFYDTEEETGMVGTVDWSPDSRIIYWPNMVGVLQIDIESKDITRILPDCDNHYYTDVLVASDGSYLLGEASDVRIYPPDTLYQEIHIDKISLDGSHVERIVLDK